MGGICWGVASAEKQLGSDREVPLLGTRPGQILGVPQPLSSALCLHLHPYHPPHRSRGSAPRPPAANAPTASKQLVTPWRQHLTSAPRGLRDHGGKERSCIFTGNAEDVTFSFFLHLQMKQAHQSLNFFLEKKFWKHFLWISPNVQCQQSQNISLQFGLFQTEVERTLKLNLFLNVILNKERNSSAWKC